MSDIFGGLFSGGDGSDGSSTDFAPTGGQGGGDFLSSMFGGQSGGDLSSAIGGMGMGNFDPSQLFNQNPQQAVAQGGDPGGQLAASQGQGSSQGQGNGQGGQGGGQGQRNPIGDFFKIFGDALTGKMQQPGYTPLGGLAQQAQGGQGGQLPQQPSFDQPANTSTPGQPAPGAAGAQPGAVNPAAPTSSTASAGPPAAGTPQMDQNAPIPPSRPADLGGQGGQQPENAPLPPARPASLGPGAPGGAKPGSAPGGAQPGGGGQQGFGQFMQSPLGQLVQGLIGQMLGRMGPQGQALAQMLSPMLAQLAGQAGFGGQGAPGQQGNPEYPPILRGREMWNRALPGGAAGRTGNQFTDTVVGAESNGKNIVSGTDRDSRGLTAAQGGNPNEISQGYFQIQNHPGGTWQTYARRAGVDLNQYPTPRSAPFEVQHKVAQMIPINQWGPRTQRILQSKFGSFNGHQTLGQVEASYGGGQQVTQTFQPNIADLRRRRRQRLAESWQF